MTVCELITYNGNMSLAWNISDDQMEKCIREILNADSKQMQTVLDDTNNGIAQFFYTLQQPFIESDTACYSNDTMDEIYDLTIVCVNSTESLEILFDKYFYKNLNSFQKPLPGKWIRIVRVGLASFSVFLAAIIVCIILFLFVVLLKCIQRLLLIRRMPQSQHTVIKHVISDMGMEDVTQESSRKSSTTHHRQRASALKLLHLNDMRPFIGCLF
ncbi:unnamed protein product [Onchocerca flexuosa]|uniref:G_PROTEIN_RECEP_F1_2 domain-containing protein n=1 Tax=Onchocerca flexuosa TaxID=387005 RepID=A0A183HY10_9BILA|nr:unnamed protein product [Onchocerca flexuosa]